MRRRCLVVIGLGGLLSLATPALGCSCAVGDPRDALEEYDGAFVGTVVSREEDGDDAIVTFRVERAVKGDIGRVIEVATHSDDTSCGLLAGPGDRMGLLVDRDEGEWQGGLCGQMDPEVLLDAAEPLPAPEGKGPVALFIGGSFGPARLVAVDEAGETLGYAYGRGSTLSVDLCPQTRRIVEAVVGGRADLVVRDARSLRVLAEYRFPPHLDPMMDQWHEAGEVWCLDEDATELLATTGAGYAETRVIHVSRGEVSVVFQGLASGVVVRGETIYVNRGEHGGDLVALDPDLSSVRHVADVPIHAIGLAISPSGRYLAGVQYGDAEPLNPHPSRAFVVDLRTNSARTDGFGSAHVLGEMEWVDDDRVAFLPGGGESTPGLVYDLKMRVRGSFSGWDASDSEVVDGRAYGVGWGRLMTTELLPSGLVRGLGALESPDTYTVAPVTDHLVLGRAATSRTAPIRAQPNGKGPRGAGSAAGSPADDSRKPRGPGGPVLLAVIVGIAVVLFVAARRRSGLRDRPAG